MLVNPQKHPNVKKELGQQFIEWLVSSEGQKAIADYKIDGQQLFYPECRRSGRVMHMFARPACGWRWVGLVGLALIAQLVPASATDDGCEKFAWSLARERAWFAVSDKTSVAAGAILPPFQKKPSS